MSSCLARWVGVSQHEKGDSGGGHFCTAWKFNQDSMEIFIGKVPEYTRLSIKLD